MEHDQGDPDAFKDQIELIVKTAATLTSLFVGGTTKAIIGAVQKLVVEAINWLIDTHDDLVETVYRVIETDDLRRMALGAPRRFVGDKTFFVPSAFPPITSVKIETDILHHFATAHKGGGGKYSVCFRLKTGSAGSAVVLPVDLHRRCWAYRPSRRSLLPIHLTASLGRVPGRGSLRIRASVDAAEPRSLTPI